ncbi:hypothetical protein [Hansschlegelia quercus]|uniref:Uncharacterized protein n=1 Tax=Hansschlegelia quercus TaxID=2528245 RepID=A0A4Q9GL36_9HYPH|nr:hypothetical protein [Hansschlegelia quercus]TBN54938.1 hypothetical protein EYR15_01950 [Hansschlegelia quercus]
MAKEKVVSLTSTQLSEIFFDLSDQASQQGHVYLHYLLQNAAIEAAALDSEFVTGGLTVNAARPDLFEGLRRASRLFWLR